MNFSSIGSGKLQLYAGAGFPVEVQLRSSGLPSRSSSSSPVASGKAGGTGERRGTIQIRQDK